MKKIISAICLAMAMLAGSVFAADKKDIGFYGKATIGYASITPTEEYYSGSWSHFEIAPVFGVTGLVPLPHFAIEGFLNFDFGGKNYVLADVQSIILAPGSRAVWAPPISFFSGKKGTWQDQLIPYVGAGFSVPIAFIEVKSPIGNSSDSKAYFDGEIQFGCRWAFNDKIAVLAEDNICFGGIFKHSFTVGAIYTFK